VKIHFPALAGIGWEKFIAGPGPRVEVFKELAGVQYRIRRPDNRNVDASAGKDGKGNVQDRYMAGFSI
jgi:hypothetical protein